MSMFIELNPNMSVEEMKAAIKKNDATLRTLKNKIKAMDEIQRDTSGFNAELMFDVEDDIDELEEIEDEISETEEFKYYYDNMMDAINSDDDIEQAINDSLPVIENGNYINIIRRIILELIKEKDVYASLLEDKDTKEDAIKEIDKIDSMIDIIKNHHTIKSEESSLITKTKNNIIFLKTVSGNVYAESDLASIDAEYYPGFKTLIESIEDGTFRNVKKFASNHTTLKGIFEVKDHGIRVVFDKINKNTYIILDIFVKRATRDMGYVSSLVNRVANYRKEESTIKSQLNEDIITEDMTILENLKKGLDNKHIVKTKGGDTNGL